MDGPGLYGLAVWLDCVASPDPVWKLLLAFLTPALVVISLILAARSIHSTRVIARQKATIDLIEKSESTQHYRDLAAAFAMAKKDGMLDRLGDPQNPRDKKLRSQVLGYLNHYELIAIGIEDNILDETIYRKWMQSSAVADWNDAVPFVQGERWRLNADKTGFDYTAALFVRFQRAVRRWSNDAVSLSEAYGERPILPRGDPGPGDTHLPATKPTE